MRDPDPPDEPAVWRVAWRWWWVAVAMIVVGSWLDGWSGWALWAGAVLALVLAATEGRAQGGRRGE